MALTSHRFPVLKLCITPPPKKNSFVKNHSCLNRYIPQYAKLGGVNFDTTPGPNQEVKNFFEFHLLVTFHNICLILEDKEIPVVKIQKIWGKYEIISNNCKP